MVYRTPAELGKWQLTVLTDSLAHRHFKALESTFYKETLWTRKAHLGVCAQSAQNGLWLKCTKNQPANEQAC